MISKDGKRQVHLRISDEQYCMLQEMWKENCMAIGRFVSKSEFIREKLFSSDVSCAPSVS